MSSFLFVVHLLYMILYDMILKETTLNGFSSWQNSDRTIYDLFQHWKDEERWWWIIRVIKTNNDRYTITIIMISTIFIILLLLPIITTSYIINQWKRGDSLLSRRNDWLREEITADLQDRFSFLIQHRFSLLIHNSNTRAIIGASKTTKVC